MRYRTATTCRRGAQNSRRNWRHRLCVTCMPFGRGVPRPTRQKKAAGTPAAQV